MRNNRARAAFCLSAVSPAAVAAPAPPVYCETLERRVLRSASPWDPIAKPDFSDVSDLTLNGTATAEPASATGTAELVITHAEDGQTGSAFWSDPRRVRFFEGGGYSGFHAEFGLRIDAGGSGPAEGLFFVLQNDDRGPEALGQPGGGMGWEGVRQSVGVKFDFSAAGAGQTGLYVNGEAVSHDPADPRNRSLPEGLDLASGQTVRVYLSYEDGAKVVRETIRVGGTEAFFTYDVDLPSIVGASTAYVGFTAATGDTAADANARQAVTDVSYSVYHGDPFGGRVTQVFVNGPSLDSGTGANASAFRAAAGIDPTYGYPVPAGPRQLKPIPWYGSVNEIALRFNMDLEGYIESDDLLLRGVRAEYHPNAFRYDRATRTAVWTLPNPVFDDRLRIFIDDTRVLGLDGDWRNGEQAYPSGDGSSGGDFDFRLNVLRGDANQDGAVNAQDLAFVKQRMNKSAANPGVGPSAYSPFADINADGLIDARELAGIKQRLNTRLPLGTPAALW